jgi:hypothetical protein
MSKGRATVKKLIPHNTQKRGKKKFEFQRLVYAAKYAEFSRKKPEKYAQKIKV